MQNKERGGRRRVGACSGSDSDSDDECNLQAKGDFGLQMNYFFLVIARHFPRASAQRPTHPPFRTKSLFCSPLILSSHFLPTGLDTIFNECSEQGTRTHVAAFALERASTCLVLVWFLCGAVSLAGKRNPAAARKRPRQGGQKGAIKST